MMDRTLVENLPGLVNEEVTLGLIVDTVRDQKHMVFILARDGTGPIQLIVFKATYERHEELSSLLPGSTIKVTGKVVASKQSKTNGLEVQVLDAEVCSRAWERPITDESHLDLRLNFRVVDLKSERSQLMLKVRNAFEQGCREYTVGHRGFTEIHTPKLMGGASESGSEVFKVDYFDTKAFLAQSPQFYKQMAIATGLEGIFEIGPVFRAETSRSSRHMTEFTGLDVEFAWATETRDVMHLEYHMLQHAFWKLAPLVDDVKRVFGMDLPINPEVRYITLDEAKKILGLNVPQHVDLTDENERQLYEKLGVDLIFVSDYPIAKRPFYHLWDEAQGTTKSFDLIFRGIEITTGALREHRLDILVAQAIVKGVDPASIKHYLDNFRYGCAPHGGFGLGIERVIAKLLGYASVKETALVARDPERLVP